MLKVISVSFSLSRGGAAIAARKFIDLITGDPGVSIVVSINQDMAGWMQFCKRLTSHFLGKLQFDSNPIKHSLNLFSYKPVLSSFEQDIQAIHHLHWINNDTLSIFDLDKIPPGSIITMHDEWFYCGDEHYYHNRGSDLDFIHGYSIFKKGVYGIHWSYFIWKIKKRKLSKRKDLIFTVPSRWMMERSRSSIILKTFDIRYLPNPIDTDLFSPASKTSTSEFRSGLNLLPDDFVFAFGAIGGKINYFKGSHLLEEALRILHTWLTKDERQRTKLLDFGGNRTEIAIRNGFKNISIGHIRNPNELALLFSAVNTVIVPSIAESFGQVAAEASACATPVICFETSGLKDIVIDGETGFLAECFSSMSLAKKMYAIFVMTNSERMRMGEKARKRVLSSFSYPVIADRYMKILEDAKKMKKEILTQG